MDTGKVHYGKTLGQIAYDGYSATGDGKTHDGKEALPTWDKLSDATRAKWEAAASNVAGTVINNRTRKF